MDGDKNCKKKNVPDESNDNIAGNVSNGLVVFYHPLPNDSSPLLYERVKSIMTENFSAGKN